MVCTLPAYLMSSEGTAALSVRPFHSTGDVLTYTRLPWVEPPAPSYVELLYEDEHMVSHYGTVLTTPCVLPSQCLQ